MATGVQKRAIYGYVEFKSKHLKSYRKRWLVLYEGTANSPAVLVKYTNEKEAQNNHDGRHKYYFNDVISAEKLTGKDNKGVRVRLKTEECKEISFICDSEARADDWVTCIQKEVAGSRDSFQASLIHSAHTNIQGNVTLQIAEGNVTVIQMDVIVLRIPLTTIRKYQMDADSVFWIETGRSSPIGEGFLHFRSDFAYCVLSRLDDQARQQNQSSSGSPPGSDYNPSPAPHGDNALYTPGGPPPPALPLQRDRLLSDPQVLPPHQYPNIPPSRSLPRIDIYERSTGFDYRQGDNAPGLHDQRQWPGNQGQGRDPGFQVQGRGPGFQGQGYERDPRFDQGQGFTRDPGYQGQGRDPGYQGQHHGRRLGSGSGMVARNPNSLPREPNPRSPYMPMQNPVSKQDLSRIQEDHNSYTDMFQAERDSSRFDYLTPTHGHPNARYRSDNRNS